MPVLVKTPEEFIEEHGGRPLMSINDHEWLCKDGARMARWGHGTNFVEPPENPREQLQLRLRYARWALSRAAGDFDKLKGGMLGRTGYSVFQWDERFYGEPAPPDPKTCLTRLAEVARERKAAVESIETEYNSLPEVVEQQRREEAARQAEREAAARHQKELAEIGRITI